MKRIWFVFCAWCSLVLCSCAQNEDAFFAEAFADAAVQTESGALPEDGKETERTEAQTERAVIMVDVSGAVLHPGVYALREGDRVCDAIDLAGGVTQDADLGSLNRAAFLQDADKIIVYRAGEAQQAAPAQETGDGRVNINRADVGELCTLSGIGEARARDIIAYREANGEFASIEDIMKVSGIKEATYNRIKDEIAVR